MFFDIITQPAPPPIKEYMERKDVVLKIKNILDNLEGVCSTKLQGEAILNELERVGMLPPSTKKLKKYETDGRLMEIVEIVNEWENE